MPQPPSHTLDRRLQARALASLIFMGVGVGVLTLLFPHSDRLEDAALAAVLATATVLGVWIWLRAGSAREWEIHAVLGLSTVLIGAGNSFADGTDLFPLMFTWVGLYSFYFFDPRLGLGYIGLIGVVYAISLLGADQTGEAVRWLLAVGTSLGGGLLVTRLLDEVRLNAADTAVKDTALRAREARTQAIVDCAPDALVTLDREGTIVMFNPAAERMFGFSAEEAIGRYARDLIVRPEDVEAHLERIGRDFTSPEREVEANVREAKLMRRDGSHVPVEMIIKRVRAGGEDVITTFSHDLTDRIRRDEERLELAREQAAREDAEQMAGVVHGLQLLIDAALANNRLDDMLTALLPRLREVLQAEAAVILLADEEDGLVVRATTGAGGPEAARRLATGEGIAGRVAADRAPRLDTDPDPAELSDPALAGMGSVISVPLAAGEPTTGVIQVGVPAPRHFGEEDLLLLSLAADRVALAIDHARIYEREHRIAETLQRSLLPERLPTLPGLEVAARYLPAAAEAEVGGDWYDVIPIHSGCVGLVMGDVAGKGLAAASMVGRLRSAVRAYALEGHEPAEVVERLNQLVFSEADDGNMATLVYVVVDPGAGRLRWVNAGHPPPLVVGDGDPAFLHAPGDVPLGVMPFPGYVARETDLDEDATVLLYTDGLVERPGENLNAGLARLTLAVLSADGPDALCEHVLDRLVPPGGAVDDVALLALRYPALADRFSVHIPADPGELAALRTLLRRWLVRAGAVEEEMAEILTAAGEATSNAIEHAGHGIGRGVDVVAEASGDDIRLTISDTGRWRPQRDNDGGRGLLLMRALMDEVGVEAAAEGTTVSMRRALARRGGGVLGDEVER